MRIFWPCSVTDNWGGRWNAISNRRGTTRRNSPPSSQPKGCNLSPPFSPPRKPWQKATAALDAFDWLLRWLRDVLLVAVGAGSDHVLNLDQRAGMQALAERVDIDELLDLISDLEKLERQAHRNLNVQMALETILLRVRQLLNPHDPADAPR